MPDWTWTDFDTLEIDPGNLEDIRSFEPPEDCLLPESERLANYLMRLLGVMHDGAWKFVQPILTDQRCPPLIQAKMQIEISDYLESSWLSLSNLEVILNEISASIKACSQFGDNISGINSAIGILIEKFTLLQVDFSAFKLQIDKLYIDKFHIDGDASGGASSAIEKAFMHTNGPDKFSILDTALLRHEIIPGDEGLRRKGEMVSHIEAIEEDLVSLEMTEPSIEITPGTLVYAKSKIVREA